MRTLNRPMFNMGGPIKEGVMHGIREPYGKAGWVKKTAKYIPGGTKAVKKIERSTKDLFPRIGKWFKDVYTGPKKGKGYVPPGIASNRWYWEKGIKPTGQVIGAGIKKTIPYAATIGAVGGLGYGGYRGLTGGPDMEEVSETLVDQFKPSGPDYGPHTKKKTIPQSIKDKWAAEARDKRVNNLLEIMGYDKAQKNAAYDALIDAGRIISERGTLDPKNISRELIDPIIGATSKRFDKPQEIREAVGLLMAKGEIEKDIAAGKGSALKQQATDLVNAGVFKTQQQALEHLGNVKSISEKAVTYAGTMKKTGIDQEVVIMTMDDHYGQRPTVLVSEDEMEDEEEKEGYKDDLTVFEAIKNNQKLGPGYYVIGASGFVVDSNGRTRQVLG